LSSFNLFKFMRTMATILRNSVKCMQYLTKSPKTLIAKNLTERTKYLSFSPRFITFNTNDSIETFETLTEEKTVNELKVQEKQFNESSLGDSPVGPTFNLDPVDKPLYTQDDELDVLYRRVEILCLAHESEVLDSFETFAKMTLQGLDIPVEVESPCRIVERKTVLRSAFVHKKWRIQYEWYTHYRLFKLSHLTGSTADTVLEYLQRNLPEGVGMEVAKTRVERLPSGVMPNHGATVSKEEVFGGRRTYPIDTVVQEFPVGPLGKRDWLGFKDIHVPPDPNPPKTEA